MAWGLELDAQTLRLCRAGLRRGKLHLSARVEVPLPTGLLKPSAAEANVTDPGDLADRLRDLRHRAGCSGWVRLALPDWLFSLRCVATDQLPERRDEARRFLRWQVRESLPFPAEEARLDFLPLPAGPDGRQRVACLLARERVLAEYEAVLLAAGLRVAVLEARSFGLAQAASAALAEGTIGLLAIAERQTTLLLLQNGRPRLWRILSEGAAGWSADGRQRLVREVADTLAFYDASEGLGRVDRLLLAGRGTRLDEATAALAEWLEVAVSRLNLSAALRTGLPAEDLVAWGPAIGVAIRPC
jgi:Tfp pilus assembly PilM family ATPase